MNRIKINQINSTIEWKIKGRRKENIIVFNSCRLEKPLYNFSAHIMIIVEKMYKFDCT